MTRAILLGLMEDKRTGNQLDSMTWLECYPSVWSWSIDYIRTGIVLHAQTDFLHLSHIYLKVLFYFYFLLFSIWLHFLWSPWCNLLTLALHQLGIRLVEVKKKKKKISSYWKSSEHSASTFVPFFSLFLALSCLSFYLSSSPCPQLTQFLQLKGVRLEGRRVRIEETGSFDFWLKLQDKVQ